MNSNGKVWQLEANSPLSRLVDSKTLLVFARFINIVVLDLLRGSFFVFLGISFISATAKPDPTLVAYWIKQQWVTLLIMMLIWVMILRSVEYLFEVFVRKSRSKNKNELG